MSTANSDPQQHLPLGTGPEASATGSMRRVSPRSRRLDAATRRRNLERVRAIRDQLEAIADIADIA